MAKGPLNAFTIRALAALAVLVLTRTEVIAQSTMTQRLARTTLFENPNFYFDGKNIVPVEAPDVQFYKQTSCPTNMEIPAHSKGQEYWTHNNSCDTGNGPVVGDGYNSWAYINAITRDEHGNPQWLSEGRADASSKNNWLETWGLDNQSRPIMFTFCQSDQPLTTVKLWKLWNYRCYTVSPSVCAAIRTDKTEASQILLRLRQRIQTGQIEYDGKEATDLLQHIHRMKFNTKVRFDVLRFKDALMDRSDSRSAANDQVISTLKLGCDFFNQFRARRP